jgi:gas vesicle protein
LNAPWSRRRFTGALAGAAAGAAAVPLVALSSASAATKGSAKRKRVALITTIVRKFSHGQHFVDRLLEVYGWHGEHHTSQLELVSLYVEQFPETDTSGERSKRHGVKLCPTIAEALTLGTSRLAVDGVLFIGEHGDYPRDAKGQPLYPRFRFFKDVVKTFERTRHSVPVFQDKHFAMDWREAQETYRDAQRLGLPLTAAALCHRTP